MVYIILITADYNGLLYMARVLVSPLVDTDGKTCFDPIEAAVVLYRMMLLEEAQPQQSQVPIYLRTHPRASDRLKGVELNLPKVGSEVRN